MKCSQLQALLSLYLYGELDFAREEELESHLGECAFCQLSLAREKQLHTLASAQIHEPALDLLAHCRQQLRPALARERARPHVSWSWLRFANPFEFSFTRWSSQIALTSLFVFIGFASARWLDHRTPESLTNEASLFDPASSRIRDIQADEAGQVRIVLDQEREITGHIGDANVRRLLLAGTREVDPDVRFYAFEILTREENSHGAQQGNADLRTVLFESARTDPNSAVRLKAIEGLRPFCADPAALETLRFVLEHDTNPGVRSQAIDILAPSDNSIAVTPAMTHTIQEVMRSTQDDDYVRARCNQVLHQAKLPVVY
jgi:hypothetical protein